MYALIRVFPFITQKKPKKKKKPVSLARRLSGYRSSQSDSSDNLAEIPQKRRKVQSKLQKIASTYKNASTRAGSRARAGGQSTTHSDTSTRDVAEEVNTSDVVRSDVMQVCDTPRNVLTSAEGSGEQPAENIAAVVDEVEQMQGCDGDRPGNLSNVAVCGEESSMSTSTVNRPFASIEENREAEEIESVSCEQPAENIVAVVDEAEQMQGCDGDRPGNLSNVAVCGQESSMSTLTVNRPFALIEENREAEEIESVSCATVSNNSTSHESGIRVALDPCAGLTASLVGCRITNSHKDVSEQVEEGTGEDSRVDDTEKESSSSLTVANNSPFMNLTQEQINAQSVLDDLALSSEDEDGEGGMDWESDNSHFVETEHDSAYDFESVLDSSQVIATSDNLRLNGAEKVASQVLSSEEPTVASSEDSVEAGEPSLRSNLASSLPEKEMSNTNSKSCKDSNSMQFERLSATTDFSPVDDTSDGEHRRVDSSQSSASQDKDAALQVTEGGEKELAIHCEEEAMDLQEEQRALVNISSSADEGTTHESATGSESGELATGSESGELLHSVFDTRDKPTNETGSVLSSGVERGVDAMCGNGVRVRQLSREKAALEERGSNSDQRAGEPHIITCNEEHVSRDANAPKTATSRPTVAEDVSNIGGNEVSLTGSKGRGRNRPQDKNSRNVSAKKSSNKRSAKTPAKKSPGKKNSKRSQIVSDKTNSQVNGNDIQTTKSSTSREKPKNTEDQAESLEEVAKAQFRNRSSIFAHDMHTLELLWNFKGR